MDFNSVLQAITTVGFPIVMCLILMWYVKYITEEHKNETDKFTEALNQNTTALNKLINKLDMEEKD